MTPVRQRLLARAKAIGDDANLRFFREWLKNPLKVAAISPSSRDLTDKMLEQLPDGATRVIELGGGTGVFTEGILERGIAPDDLFVLELNQTLHAHLIQRFPGATVVCGDAREVDQLARRSGWLAHGGADAVISGLGILSMGRAMQKAVLKAAFNAMKPGGRFIQFTYGPVTPVAREVLAELDLVSRKTGFALLNLPPATVFRITRSKSKRVPASAPAR